MERMVRHRGIANELSMTFAAWGAKSSTADALPSPADPDHAPTGNAPPLSLAQGGHGASAARDRCRSLKSFGLNGESSSRPVSGLPPVSEPAHAIACLNLPAREVAVCAASFVNSMEVPMAPGVSSKMIQ